jgi:hypothetical protein
MLKSLSAGLVGNENQRVVYPDSKRWKQKRIYRIGRKFSAIRFRIFLPRRQRVDAGSQVHHRTAD